MKEGEIERKKKQSQTTIKRIKIKFDKLKI
jgi:hypothetical protein